MATTTESTTELAMKLRLTKTASEKLAQRAAESGRDVAAVASDMIEQAVSRPTIDEILAPVRKQVAERGMTEEQLMDFGRDLLKKVREEREGFVSDRAVYDTMIFFQ